MPRSLLENGEGAGKNSRLFSLHLVLTMVTYCNPSSMSKAELVSSIARSNLFGSRRLKHFSLDAPRPVGVAPYCAPPLLYKAVCPYLVSG